MPLEFKPKLDKIVELLLYLAWKRPGSDLYQAVKFFYLADKEHLNRYGRPITQEQYFALPYGPVASKAKNLLDRDAWVFREANIKELPFKLEEVRRGKTLTVALTEPKRQVERDLFSKSDLRVFDEILEEHGDKSFDDLYQLTHGHFAYIRAWNSRPKGSKAAPMSYEDMIESPERREAIVRDFGPVAAHM